MHRAICALTAACVAVTVTQPAQAGSCLDGNGGCKLTLQQESTPQEQPWTQPARVAYTFNNDGKDSYAIDLAGKAVFPLKTDSPIFLLADVSWNTNNQQKKEQNNFRGSAGLHFEFQSAPPERAFDKDKLFSLWIDAKLGYNRKSVFADKTNLPVSQILPFRLVGPNMSGVFGEQSIFRLIGESSRAISLTLSQALMGRRRVGLTVQAWPIALALLAHSFMIMLLRTR